MLSSTLSFDIEVKNTNDVGMSRKGEAVCNSDATIYTAEIFISRYNNATITIIMKHIYIHVLYICCYKHNWYLVVLMNNNLEVQVFLQHVK